MTFLFLAHGLLLVWTAEQLLPLEQGQALTSLAWGVVGTTLLVAGFLVGRSLMHKSGMATLLLVAGKLLLVDLASVEPIWRVLLFSVFGGLFLILAKVTEGRRKGGDGEPEEEERGRPGS